MMTTDQLLDQIEAYCKRKGVAESTFGRLVVNDGKLVSRLRAGKTISLRTFSRIVDALAADAAS